MRIPPRHVTEAVRRYDRELELDWNQTVNRWQVRHRGRVVVQLHHHDGRPMLSLDGYTDEILSVIRAADNTVSGPSRLKAMKAGAREFTYRRRQEKAATREELRKVSEEIVDVAERGVSPFIPPVVRGESKGG